MFFSCLKFSFYLSFIYRATEEGIHMAWSGCEDLHRSDVWGDYQSHGNLAACARSQRQELFYMLYSISWKVRSNLWDRWKTCVNPCAYIPLHCQTMSPAGCKTQTLLYPSVPGWQDTASCLCWYWWTNSWLVFLARERFSFWKHSWRGWFPPRHGDSWWICLLPAHGRGHLVYSGPLQQATIVGTKVNPWLSALIKFFFSKGSLSRNTQPCSKVDGISWSDDFTLINLH